jgi:hypothetical protein
MMLQGVYRNDAARVTVRLLRTGKVTEWKELRVGEKER